jgi:hypothetical protein
MSEEYDNTNKGVLFINSYKENSKQPDVKGELDVEGVAYKMAGWIRTKKESTEKFFSLSIELRDKPPPAKSDQDPIDEILGIVAEMGNEPPAETQKPSEGHTEAPQGDIGGEDVPF